MPLSNSGWDKNPKPRRQPIAEYVRWKNSGGVTTYPVINQPMPLPIELRQRFIPAASYVEPKGQTLMFFPYKATSINAGPLPVHRTMADIKNHPLNQEHDPKRIFFGRDLWGGIEKRMGFHAGDDTFCHAVEGGNLKPKTVETANNNHLQMRFSAAPSNARIIFDLATKRVLLVCNPLYDVPEKYEKFGNLSKREYLAMLLDIKHNNGKVLSRKVDKVIVYIGSYADCLHFVNYRADGIRREYPTGFRNTLIVEDFR